MYGLIGKMIAAPGKRDEFIGRLQQRYGYEKDQAEKELDGFLTDIDRTGKTTH